jgi:uncharacterized protein YraI
MRKFGLVMITLALVVGAQIPPGAIAAPLDVYPQLETTATATTTDRLNLRTGPATSYPTITVIPTGSKVILTGQDSNGFRSVSFNGQEGWAFGTYLSIDAPTPSPSATATTTDRLNLRSGPGTSYSTVTVLPLGAVVTLTGQNTNGFRSVTWSGFSGWAYAEYLNFGTTPPPPPVPEDTATTTDALNLRTGPGATFSVILVMPRGAEVILTGQTSNGYRSVSYNGVNGWASADYLAAEGTVPVPAGTATAIDRLNLRSGPDTSSSVLTVIPNGAVVTLTGQSSNGFRSVSYNGYTGWAFEAYLSIDSTTPPVPDAPFDVTNTIVGPARGSVSEAMSYARAAGALRITEVERYVNEIYRLAPQIGFDPAILVAQSAHETGNWKSSWWNLRLNPAGIGVTGDPTQNNASPTFSSGTIAARAQMAHMHAEVFGNSRALPAVLQGVDPTYQRVFAAGWAGTIRTIEDLAGTWAVDPDYHTKLVRKAIAVFDPGA